MKKFFILVTIATLISGSASSQDFDLKIGNSLRHIPYFYIGVNNLCHDRIPNPAKSLPQRGGKGLEFGFTFLEYGYQINDFLDLSTSPYLSRSRYWLANANYLALSKDIMNNRRLIITNSDWDGQEVKQGYLRYWSVRIPVNIEIHSANSRGPWLVLGPELEYRFGEASIVKTEGSKKRKRVTNDLNTNPLSLNAVLKFGIDDFGIIARYSFNSLFNEDNPVDVAPFMIGLAFDFSAEFHYSR
ncbi:MAG: hypothetical protein IKS24_09055 [Bacteroidaceae bacterium]|nr:hypothetical protein [Bacteroidaceae bacterium]